MSLTKECLFINDNILPMRGMSQQHPTTGIHNVKDLTFEGQVYKIITELQPYLFEEAVILDLIIKKLDREKEI